MARSWHARRKRRERRCSSTEENSSHTVVKGLHSRESVRDAAKWISGAKEYYLQQFKDSGHVLDIRGLGAYDEAEMHSLADAAAEYVPSVQVRGV